MKRIIAIALLLLFTFSAVTVLNAEEADKNKLRELLTDTYDAEQYTPETYEEYRNARKYAFDVYEYADALPVQVETAISRLENAVKNLKKPIDTRVLSDYISSLEGYLYSNTHHVSESVRSQLTAATKEFRALLNSESVTEEQLAAATATYQAMILLADGDAYEILPVTPYDEQTDGLVIPENFNEQKKTSGKVTELRLWMTVFGGILILVGITVTVIYLATARKAKNLIESKSKAK